MNLPSSKKFGDGLKLGLVLGVLIGTVRLVWFLVTENYQAIEIQHVWLNLLYTSVDRSVLLSMLVCLIFTFLWCFYDRLEGLTLAGLITAPVFLPLIYFINVRYLPGFRETASMLGNGGLVVLTLAVTFVLFNRWTKDKRFIPILTRRFLLWPALLLYVGLMLGYRLQSDAVQLHATPDSPETLIEVLDLDQIKEAMGVTNGIDPGVLLQRYYETRLTERAARLRAKIAARDTATIIAYADSFLQRRFSFNGVALTLPQKIDWRSNPTEDKAWLFALNRQEWIWDLAAAYSLTHDAKYARGFEEILGEWLKQNPRLDWKNEADPVWRLMETSLRMSASWIDAFTVFFLSGEISENLKWRMLGSFHEHAQFLAHFRSPGKNHLMQESYGLLAVAGAFPEFKMSADWLRIADLRLNTTLAKEIYPDGGYLEGSTFYHRFVIRILQQIVDFASEYNVVLSGDIHAHLERLYTFLMHMARPDGVMPQMNDGFRAKNLRPLYQQPAGVFRRDDFEFFATAGERGSEPEPRSVGFPYSGVYVMRSDWTEDARYMIIDAGLFGSAHGHEDKLSFELFAYGKPFIVESGTYTYRYDRWHRYFESSFAHNTIVVDGRSQLRQPDRDNWAADPPRKLPNVWYSDSTLDYLEARYVEGYGNQKENVLHGFTHTRRILFVKPDYWILWDILEGAGQHSASLLFHFDAQTRVTRDNQRDVKAEHGNGAYLLLKSLSPRDVKLTQVSGLEGPIQGWVSPEYGVKMPAEVVDFEVSGQLPLVFVNILYPSKGTGSEFFEAKLRRVSDGTKTRPLSEAIAVEVTSSRFTDFVLLAPNSTTLSQSDSIRTSADLFMTRQYNDDGGGVLEKEIEKLDRGN